MYHKPADKRGTSEPQNGKQRAKKQRATVCEKQETMSDNMRKAENSEQGTMGEGD
jgi:hypothetical protein